MTTEEMRRYAEVMRMYATEHLVHARRTLDRECARYPRGSAALEGTVEMVWAMDTVLCERCSHE